MDSAGSQMESQPRVSEQGSQLATSSHTVHPKSKGSGHRRKQSRASFKGLSAYTGTPETLARVTEAFQTFDTEQSNFVNIRAVGPIVRSLGLCPTEFELSEIVRDVEDGEVKGRTAQDRFTPIVAQLVHDNRYPQCTAENLLAAMKVLDIENKGYLTREEMTAYLTTRGEPFSEEEVLDALKMMDRKNTGNIDYFDYVSDMSHDIEKNMPAK